MEKQALLFWGSGSIPCWKPMIVLAEKGIKYESKQISFGDKGHKGEEVTKLNPRGQVPTFRDEDGTVLCESNAICFYLENKYKGKGTELIPSDVLASAPVLQKGFEALENFQAKQMYGILYYHWQTKEEDRKEETTKKNKDNYRDELNVWEKYLEESGTPFVCGKEFTMADVFFFPFIAWAWRMSLDLSQWPKINDYFTRLRERPSIKTSWPPHWHEDGGNPPEKMAFLKDVKRG